MLHQAAEGAALPLRGEGIGGGVHIGEQLQGAGVPHHRLGQQAHGHADGAAVPLIQGTVQVSEHHLHLADRLLPRPADLHDLGEGQLVLRRTQRPRRGAIEELELALPLEDELVADHLGLAAPQGDPAFQQLLRLRLAAGQGDLVGEGEGLLPQADNGTRLPGLHQLLDARLLGGLDAAAQLLLHRGAGLEPDGQAHPHQHFPGIKQTGVRPLYPGNGHHPPLRRQAGVLHRAGEGQLHLHPAQPLPAVGEIEQRRPDGAGEGEPPLLHHLVPQADDPLGLTDAQDVRAGVRHDALQGLLLAHGGLQRRLITVPADPFQFQLHSVPLLVGAKARIHVVCYRTICARVPGYVLRLRPPDAEDGLEESPQRLGGFYHNDLHSQASLSARNVLSQSLPRLPAQAPAPKENRMAGWSSRAAPPTQRAAVPNHFLVCGVKKAASLRNWFCSSIRGRRQGVPIQFRWLRISSARPAVREISITWAWGSLLTDRVSPRVRVAPVRGYFRPRRVTPVTVRSRGIRDR